MKDINWFIKENNISLGVTELYCYNNNLPYSNDNLDTIKQEVKKEIRNQKLMELGI